MLSAELPSAAHLFAQDAALADEWRQVLAAVEVAIMALVLEVVRILIAVERRGWLSCISSSSASLDHVHCHAFSVRIFWHNHLVLVLECRGIKGSGTTGNDIRGHW